MIRRPPRSTRTDTLFPTRLSSDLSELRGRVQRIALPDVAERITKFLEKLFLYCLVKEEARPGEAHLALVKDGRHRCALDSRVDIGIGPNDVRRFSAEFERLRNDIRRGILDHAARSEARLVGQESVRPCRSRWSPEQ